MYRDFWQRQIDIIYDAINNEVNTQEEIDTAVASAMSVFAGFTQDATDIPSDFKRRRRRFDDPIDLMKWIERGGIPIQCIYVHEGVLSDDERVYIAYVSQDSE